jgi:hypothetical protein
MFGYRVPGGAMDLELATLDQAHDILPAALHESSGIAHCYVSDLSEVFLVHGPFLKKVLAIDLGFDIIAPGFSQEMGDYHD